MFSQMKRDPHREPPFCNVAAAFAASKPAMYKHRVIYSFCAECVPRNENILFELYSVHSSLGQFFLQSTQRVASMADGVFLLLRHFGEAFFSLEFIGKKHRIIPKAAFTR